MPLAELPAIPVCVPDELPDDDLLRDPPVLPIIPPSRLPEPGNITLQLRPTLHIATGRCGVAFEVDVVSISCPEAFMPPLIIKVSRRGFQEELRLESRAYKEMESIQGVAVPRCYGLFQATLSSSSPRIQDQIFE